MLRQRAHVIDATLRSFDLVALAGAFPIAYLIRDQVFGEKLAGQPGLYPLQRYWPLLVLTLVAWIVASSLSRLYEAYRLRTLPKEVTLLGKTLLIVVAVLGAIGFLTKEDDVSRLFVCFYFAVGMSLLVANRALLRRVLDSLRRHGYSTRIVAVVGTGDLARQAAEAVNARQDWGYHFAGYIEDVEDPAPREVGPVLGDMSRLSRMLDGKVLDEVIFAVSRERIENIEAAVVLCRAQGVTARICLDLPLRQIEALSVEEMNGLTMLSVY
jgi:FlaA1/EpsC-like NDP-sugar epimerase